MNKVLHQLYHRYKKPVGIILAFFLGLFLLDKFITGSLLLKDYSDNHALQKQRTSFDSGYADVSFYNVESDKVIDLGAAFADKILMSYSEDPTNALSKLNFAVLHEKGYEVEPEYFLSEINSFADLIADNQYELCYLDHYDELSSHGIIFNFALIKTDSDTTGEFQYEPFDRSEYSMTIYYEDGIPVSYLPFPEPALHTYASRYGLIK